MKNRGFFDDPDWPLAVLLVIFLWPIVVLLVIFLWPMVVFGLIAELDTFVKYLWKLDKKKAWKQYRCKHENYETVFESDPDAYTWFTETCKECAYSQSTNRPHYRKALINGIFGG